MNVFRIGFNFAQNVQSCIKNGLLGIKTKWMFAAFFSMFAFNVAAETQSKDLPLYENRIQQVVIIREGYNSKIVLEDGTVLNVCDKQRIRDSFENLKTWEAGDRMIMRTFGLVGAGGGGHDYFALKNLEGIEKKEKEGIRPLVELDLKSTGDAGLKIIEVSKGGRSVKLSDSTVWKFDLWNTFATGNWTGGQHVFVQGKGKKNEYEMFNLDVRPLISNAKKAKGKFVRKES